MLAVGVKARDTAERETPARCATSDEVTQCLCGFSFMRVENERKNSGGKAAADRSVSDMIRLSGIQCAQYAAKTFTEH